MQLGSVLGVEKEAGFTLNYDKYNWQPHPEHFILADCEGKVDFGEGKKGICAPQATTVYTGSSSFDLTLESGELRWYSI